MTPKGKAEQLYESIICKFKETNGIFLEYKSKETCAKKCALIAVDEILNGYEFDSLDIEHKRIMDNINYWDEVKQEIENL